MVDVEDKESEQESENENGLTQNLENPKQDEKDVLPYG